MKLATQELRVESVGRKVFGLSGRKPQLARNLPHFCRAKQLQTAWWDVRELSERVAVAVLDRQGVSAGTDPGLSISVQV